MRNIMAGYRQDDRREMLDVDALEIGDLLHDGEIDRAELVVIQEDAQAVAAGRVDPGCCTGRCRTRARADGGRPGYPRSTSRRSRSSSRSSDRSDRCERWREVGIEEAAEVRRDAPGDRWQEIEAELRTIRLRTVENQRLRRGLGRVNRRVHAARPNHGADRDGQEGTRRNTLHGAFSLLVPRLQQRLASYV